MLSGRVDSRIAAVHSVGFSDGETFSSVCMSWRFRDWCFIIFCRVCIIGLLICKSFSFPGRVGGLALVSNSPLQERAWRHAPICFESIKSSSSMGGGFLFGFDLIIFEVSSKKVFAALGDSLMLACSRSYAMNSCLLGIWASLIRFRFSVIHVVMVWGGLLSVRSSCVNSSRVVIV